MLRPGGGTWCTAALYQSRVIHRLNNAVLLNLYRQLTVEYAVFVCSSIEDRHFKKEKSAGECALTLRRMRQDGLYNINSGPTASERELEYIRIE